VDKACATAKRKKMDPKMQRAYTRALKTKPAAPPIIARFDHTSGEGETSSLLASTIDIGHEMRPPQARD